MKINIDNAKSYKSVSNADKAIAKLEISDNLKYVIAVNSIGRFVPVFSNALQLHFHLYLAHRGFMIVG